MITGGGDAFRETVRNVLMTMPIKLTSTPIDLEIGCIIVK
jgi:hypothetical protein